MAEIKSQRGNPDSVRFKPDPSRTYKKVEQLDGDSTYNDHMNAVSPSNPSEWLWREETVDARTTGHERLKLLSCSKEDAALIAKADENEARLRAGAYNLGPGEKFVSQTKQSNVLTVD